MNRLLLFALLLAPAAQAQSPVLRAILAGGGASSGAPMTTHTVATTADMLALTGTSTGESIYVTGTGRTYDVVEENTLTGPDVIDGVRVLAFDEDVESVSTSFTPASIRGSSIGADVLFGSVRITGPDANLVMGPDSLSDLDLEPGQFSGEDGFFVHATGTFADSPDLEGAAADYGSTVDVEARRVSSGVTRRILWRDFDGFYPSEMGAVAGELGSDLDGSSTLSDSLDAFSQAFKNAGAVSWAAYFAEQMPTWTDRNVRFKDGETIDVHGTVVYRDSTHWYGTGSVTPALRFPGNDLTWLFIKDAVAVSDRFVYAEQRLGKPSAKGVRHEDMRRVDFYDLYFDGNQRNNPGIWTDTDLYTTNDPLVSWLQNAPRAMMLDLGEQDGLGGPTEDADGYAGYVYIHGTLRLTDGIQGTLATPTGPTYQIRGEAVADTLWIGDVGPDDNHHCSYAMHAELTNAKLSGHGCDMMWGNNGISIDHVMYVDPAPPLWSAGNTGDVGSIDASFAPMPMRNLEDATYPFDTARVGRVTLDLPAQADNVWQIPFDANIGFASEGGTIDNDRSIVNLLIRTTGVGIQGFIGPDVTAGKDSLVITSSEPFSMRLVHNAGHTRGGTFTWRGLRMVDSLANVAGGDAWVAAGGLANSVDTYRIEHSDLLDQPGKVFGLGAADTARAGFDLHIVDTDINYGRYLLTMQGGNGCVDGGMSANDSLALLRARVIVDGNSVIQDLYGTTNCSATHRFDVALRAFDGAEDDDGRTAVETGTLSTTVANEGETEVCTTTNLMWGPREIIVDNLTASSGTYSVTSTRALDGVTEYVVGEGVTDDDFRSPDVCFTLDSAIGVGVTLNIDYTARVTPLAAQRLSRPYVITDSVPTPSVAVGATTDVDLSTMCENRDYAGNAGAGSLTYRFLESSDESVATGSISGSTVTITGVASGSATLYGLCEDAAGTESAVKLDVTVTP